MTMIYDPIPFVKLVQTFLVKNCEVIMRICEKICMIILHNLQMLFMLWIRNKFSECLASCTNMRPPMEDFLATVLPMQARRHGGAFGDSYSQIFLCPTIFCCAQKNLFWTYDKN